MASVRGTCLALLLLWGRASASHGCGITRGPRGSAPVYKCPDCAYIVRIHLFAGCWIDRVATFLCSDGTTVNVSKGGTGGTASSPIALGGFVKASVGSASGNGQLWGAAGLKLTSTAPQAYPAYGYVAGCAAGTIPVSYKLDQVITAAPSGSKLVGLQAQAGGPYGAVTSLRFLAGTTSSSVSQLGLVRFLPGGVGDYTIQSQGYTLRFTSKDPNVQASVVQNMIRCFFSSYLAQLKRFNPATTKTVTIIIDPTNTGVAGASGGVISVSADYIDAHPLDYGLIAHEGFHIVQNYAKASPEPTGHWVEGLADYARNKYGCNNAQAGWAFSNPTPSENYTNGYRVTGRFLTWLENKVNATIPTALDKVLRAGTYTDQFWVTLTGRSVEQLWQAYIANPAL